MFDFFLVSCPIYLLILIGFISTRMGLFKKEDMRILGKFVINLSLPALIFNSLSKQAFTEIFNLSYFLVYLSGSLFIIGLGLLWFRSHRENSAIYVLGMSCSNSGFVGYPILFLVLPPVAGVALSLNLIVENCFVIPLMLIIAECHLNTSGNWLRQAGQSLLGLCKNPLIIGLAGGMAVSLSGISLPVPVTHAITMLASASGGLSLFVIGGALVNLPMKGMAKQSLPIVFGKLLLHPLVVALAAVLLPFFFYLPVLTPAMCSAALLSAAMPMMGVYPIFAQKYNKESLASATLLITTVCSVFTLNIALWFIMRYGH